MNNCFKCFVDLFLKEGFESACEIRIVKQFYGRSGRFRNQIIVVQPDNQKISNNNQDVLFGQEKDPEHPFSLGSFSFLDSCDRRVFFQGELSSMNYVDRHLRFADHRRPVLFFQLHGELVVGNRSIIEDLNSSRSCIIAGKYFWSIFGSFDGTVACCNSHKIAEGLIRPMTYPTVV